MGCGKSSVGRRLSELLCCSFMDLDDVIVEKAGRSIPEIFANDGEAVFRQMEHDVLQDIVASAGRHSVPEAPSHLSMGPSPYPVNTPKIDRFPGTPGVGKCLFHTYASQPLENSTVVLALGGGAVMQEECERMVHEGTVCIYLKASVDTLLSHLEGEAAGRPLLSNATMPSGSSTVMSSETPSVMSSAPHSVMSSGAHSVMSSEVHSVMSSEVETSPLRKRILDLMNKRTATYERVAHHIIETDGKAIDQIAAEIIETLS